MMSEVVTVTFGDDVKHYISSCFLTTPPSAAFLRMKALYDEHREEETQVVDEEE